MPPNVSPEALAKARRLAYHFGPRDLAAAIQASGIPADLVPIGTAAAMAHVSASYLRQRVKARRLDGWFVGTRILVRLSDVIQCRESMLRARDS